MSGRKRQSPLSTVNEESLCAQCSGVVSDCTHYELGCNHFLCSSCMCNVLLANHYAPSISCPECRSTNNTYKLISVSYVGRNKRRRIDEKIMTIPSSPQPQPTAVASASATQEQELDKTFDPVRYYSKQPIQYQRDHMNCSYTFESSDGQMKTITEDIPLHSSGIGLNDRQQTCLEGLFQKLHTAVLHHDVRESGDMIRNSNCYSSSSKLYDMTKKDNSLLRRLMNSLGVGKLLSDTQREEEENSGDANYEKRSRLSLSAALLLRQATQAKSTSLHEACSEISRIYNFPIAAHKFLVDFGFCSSRKQLYLKETKQVHKLMEKGFKFEDRKWCLFITVYDNVGFRVRGAMCGYDQFIALQLLIISVARLKKVGFYNTDPSQPKLDRKRLKWGDVRKDSNIEDLYDVFIPSQHEYDELSYHHLKMIDEILRIINDLPSDAEISDLEASAMKKSTEWEKTRIKAEFGVRPTSEDEIVVATHVGDNEVESQTIYEKNGAEFMDTMHKDLNSKSAMQDLIKFTIETKKKALQGEDGDLTTYGGERPLMEDGISWMAGDGGPAYNFCKERDERLTESGIDLQDDVMNSSGGFHHTLTLTRARGDIFESTHLATIMKRYREGKGSQKWVLHPGDPSQMLHEMFQKSAATTTLACRETAIYLGRDITCIDVHAHMVICAGEDSNDFVIFLELKLYCIISMMVDSEKTGVDGCRNNPSLFRAGMKLSMLFYCVTNSFKYVRSISDFHVWWKCASEADRKIWEEFIFCAETADGKSIFLDRYQEWMVRGLRDSLGKFQLRDMCTKMVQAVASLNGREKVKKEMRQRTKGGAHSDPTTDSVEVGYVFVLTYLELKKIKLWRRGEKRTYINGRPTDENAFYDISGKTALNPEVISLISIAMARLREYARKYYIQGELNQVVRGYSESKLGRIPVCMDGKEEVLTKVEIWKSSLNVDKLVPFFKEDLINNLRYMNALLADAEKSPVKEPSENDNKTIWATALVEARTLAKDLVEDGDFSSPGVWNDNVVAGDTLKEKLVNALDDNFFKISDAVKARIDAKSYPVNEGNYTTPQPSPQNLQDPPQAGNSTGDRSYSLSRYSPYYNT